MSDEEIMTENMSENNANSDADKNDEKKSDIKTDTVKTKQAKKTKKNKRSARNINMSYLTKMGFKSLVLNRSMSLSSISVLTACLLLIGISFTIFFNIQSIVRNVERQNVVIAFVEDNAGEEKTAAVGNAIRNIENVLSVEFVDKASAYADQLDSFGLDDEYFSSMENPLPDSYKITISNLEAFDETLTQIVAVPNVQSVRESQELVTQISTLQKSVSLICAVVIIVLVVVSMFIITNTIRITMVSRKIDISVMKSVGATDLFIRWPFMVEGVSIGFISAALAILLVFLIERLEGDAFNSLMTLFGSSTVSIFDRWPILLACYLAAGVMIGLIGCIVSISKYLRKEGSEANDI